MYFIQRTKPFFINIRVVLVLVSFIVVGSSRAAIITTLFNTGVDSSGNVVASGSADLHWDITSSADSSYTAPADAIVQQNNPAWLANDSIGTPGSSWIGIVDNGRTRVDPGDYTAETTFDLTGFDIATAEIFVSVISDNSLRAARLNGAAISVAGSPFGVSSMPAPTTVNSGFVSGINTLEFVWRNSGSNPNPSGLRVELSGTADLTVIPEPSTVIFLGVFVCALLVGRRLKLRRNPAGC